MSDLRHEGVSMNEPSPSGAVRKRSQGNLRSSGQHQEQGKDTTEVGNDANVRSVMSKSSWYQNHRVLGVAALLFGTILVTAFLYEPWFTSVTTVFVPHKTHKPTSTSPSRESIDHVLRPEDHAFREVRTLEFDWRVTSGLRRPDGVLKEVYLINDDFLGPTVECRSGDRIVVKVHNGLTEDGIALHWHGLSMRHQNDQDGAAGITQDAIKPGADHTYNFTVGDQHGTFWYHAHDGVQRADGLFGGLIVHRPAEDNISDAERYGYDEDRLLIVGDWYHRSAKDVRAWYMRAGSFGNEPVPDSVLINGVGAYNCSMGVPARPINCNSLDAPALSLNASKTYRLRVANTGSLAGMTLRMNGFSMTAMTVDGGHSVVGSPARSVGLIYPGQRTDLLLSALEGNESEPSLDLDLDRPSFKYSNPALSHKQQFPILVEGHVHPEKASKGAGLKQFFDLADCHSPDEVKPPFPKEANMTIVLYSTSVKLAHLDNVPYGFINRTSWKVQVPNLRSSPRETWNKYQFVPQIPLVSDSDDFWVDVVLNNLDDGSHPFHIHGYDMWVLQMYAGYGWGSWNPFEAPGPPGGPLDLQHAVKRDTMMVPKRGYTVLRFRPNNPGIWMFHCHILWHEGSGMAMSFQVGNLT